MRACETWSHDKYLNHEVMELFMAELDRRAGMGSSTCADLEEWLLAAFQAAEDGEPGLAEEQIKLAADMLDW